MAVDITMKIIHKSGKVIVEDVCQGLRNSQWFQSISGGSSNNRVYENFPCDYGLIDSVIEEKKKLEQQGYYGFRNIPVKDFMEWYEKTNPNMLAAWVKRYDAYLYTEKGIDIEDYSLYLQNDFIIEDYVWLEFKNNSDFSYLIYNAIMDIMSVISSNIEDYYILYYFDC